MRKKSIKNKITYIKKHDAASLIIVLVMFLVLIAGIFVVSDNYKENQEKLIEDAMELQSQSHKEKFETFIEDKVKLLQGIASFPAVSSMVPRKQSELLKNRADELGFLHLFVMDTKGQGFYIDEGITKDQSTEPFFYNVSGNHVYITEPFYGQEQTFTTVCVSIFDIKDNILSITFEGKSFYRYMVRNLVGAMIEVARGKISIDYVREMLESKEEKTTFTAPANGLYLDFIEYN